MVGIITHHYGTKSDKFEIDPFDFPSIQQGTKDLTEAFVKYATSD